MNTEKLYADILNQSTLVDKSYFPIKVRYENGDVVIVQHPDNLRNLVSFKVLETNTKEN